MRGPRPRQRTSSSALLFATVLRGMRDFTGMVQRTSSSALLFATAIALLHLVIPAVSFQSAGALFLIDATLLQRVIAPLALAEPPVGEPLHACGSGQYT